MPLAAVRGLARAIATVVIVVCAILLALLVVAASRVGVLGGAEARPKNRTKRPVGVRGKPLPVPKGTGLTPMGVRGKPSVARPETHIIVDTLNLTYWAHTTAKRQAAITTDLIISTIDKTAPILRAKYSGRIMYVVKDRESALNGVDTRVAYGDAATRNKVYIYGVERYEDPPAGASEDPRAHSARGRDDLYMAVLARKWKCPVLTEDRFRDFDEFRRNVEPFRVYEFAYWRALPEADYVRPEALRGLKPPRAVRYPEHFGDPKQLEKSWAYPRFQALNNPKH